MSSEWIVCLCVAASIAVACTPPLEPVPRPMSPAAGVESAAPPATSTSPPAVAPSSAPAPGTDLAPLTSSSPIVELPLPKGSPAVVSLPLGSTSARPVLVATHGAGGRGENHCKMWRAVVEDRAFVLCPQGHPIYPHGPPEESGYFYNGHPALGEEITRALDALHAAYGARVDLRAPIFAGYSQGANMGSLVLPGHPARFARAVLWEGGVGEYQEWNIRVAQRFHDRGGERVLLACGRAKCYRAAQTTASYMEKGGLLTHLVFVPSAGHTTGGELGKKVQDAFAWLVEGDTRW